MSEPQTCNCGDLVLTSEEDILQVVTARDTFTIRRHYFGKARETPCT